MIGGTIAAETWLPVLIEAGTTEWINSIQTRLKPCPRELAAKAERSPEVTPKALLTRSLQRLYQPVTGAQPERFVQLLIELEQRLAERRKE